MFLLNFILGTKFCLIIPKWRCLLKAKYSGSLCNEILNPISSLISHTVKKDLFIVYIECAQTYPPLPVISPLQRARLVLVGQTYHPSVRQEKIFEIKCQKWFCRPRDEVPPPRFTHTLRGDRRVSNHVRNVAGRAELPARLFRFKSGVRYTEATLFLHPILYVCICCFLSKETKLVLGQFVFIFLTLILF